MVVSFLQRKFSNITISKKLYFTVGIMALLVTIELCTLWFSVSTLSSVRAFVDGEGLWSKAQKDATNSLLIYSQSRKESDYVDFENFLKVPFGDNKTRLELQKANPNLEIAREGFLEGRNPPEDVDGMITLLTRFHNISYLHKAINIWGVAERNMEQFITLSDSLHRIIRSNTASRAQIDNIVAEAERQNVKLTRSEDDFSFTLSEGARWMESIVRRLLLSLSLTIGITSILITISVSRGIEKGVKEIIRGASLVSEGKLDTRVKVFSRDEIGLLATSFNEMTDRLDRNIKHIQELKDTEQKLTIEKEHAEASEKAKQLFLAKMSHEIRTPMNAILGFARLLEGSTDSAEQHDYTQIIIKSGEDLLVILDDILDFSRMEAGKIVFENLPFKIRDIVRTTTLMVESRAAEKGTKIGSYVDERIPDVLLGDSVRLNQVLLNLVSNAVKFTTQGEINISIKMLSENSDFITIDFRVKDTGIGIPAEKQERIFESFEQVTNDPSRKFGGAGLGLSIVKQLVKLQKGELSVASKPGVGSEFSVRLSFKKLKQNDAIVIPLAEQAAPETGHGINVLVVEDNAINRMLVIKVLKNHGFTIDVAENGLVALEKLKTNEFDVILMDLQMPEMDGYEATRKIRQLIDHKKDIPIIAMSAHTFKGEYEHCIDIGMNDFVSKPFDTKDLYDKIHRVLKGNLHEI